jgi:Arc-like DNA binding domain
MGSFLTSRSTCGPILCVLNVALKITPLGIPMARKPTDTVQLKLRFPERLRRRIEQAGERNKQSMNAEIIERLERSFEKEDELARDRELVQKTVNVTLSEWEADWERRLRDAGVVNLLDKLREQAREQSSIARNEETKSRTGTEDKS